ncbi:hypothetical protein LCGC14_0370820 [marine sediment metagenome]|uniref:Uncharacterized protein n=1 Tax=marine sediment metagenome TaxID=412755 RepID=A0A0F9VSG2_9ZZZZ|nr:hypothetical protein [Maribacter sp.]HDZ04844.1 hypothetical protein [Maribacter sp.]
MKIEWEYPDGTKIPDEEIKELFPKHQLTERDKKALTETRLLMLIEDDGKLSLVDYLDNVKIVYHET